MTPKELDRLRRIPHNFIIQRWAEMFSLVLKRPVTPKEAYRALRQIQPRGERP